MDEPYRPMIKALIFDLDGTLANTELLHYSAWRETLMQNGVENFSFKDFLRYVGTSNEKVARDYRNSHTINKSVEQLIAEKQAFYLLRIPEIELFEGVRQVIERYRSTRLLAVASSSHQNEILEILKVHGIDDCFAFIIGGDMVVKRKPDPEIYLAVCTALKLQADECVAFEDSYHGLMAAKRAGMYGVAIPNEFTKEHDFSTADRIISSFIEVDDRFLANLAGGGYPALNTWREMMLQAKDIMTTEVITVRLETTVAELAELLTANNIGGAPVVDDRGGLLGVVTENDLIDQKKKVHIPTVINILDSVIYLENPEKMEKEIMKIAGLTVADIYTTGVLTVEKQTTLDEIATIMSEKNVHTLPVIDDGQLVGIIGKHDIIKTLIP
jgi:HAD superfamily hydrolase (TIGR01509 family)